MKSACQCYVALWMAATAAVSGLAGCATYPDTKVQGDQTPAKNGVAQPPVGADYGFSVANRTPYTVTVQGTTGPGKFSLPPSSVQPLRLSNFRMIFQYGQDNQSVISYRIAFAPYLMQVTATPGWSIYPPQMSCNWTDLAGKPTSPPPGIACEVNADHDKVSVIQPGLNLVEFKSELNQPVRFATSDHNKFAKQPPTILNPAQVATGAVSADARNVRFRYQTFVARRGFKFSIIDSRLGCEFSELEGPTPTRYSGPSYPSCTAGSEFEPFTFTLRPPTTPARPITIRNESGKELLFYGDWHTYLYNALPDKLPSPGTVVAQTATGARVIIAVFDQPSRVAFDIQTEDDGTVYCNGPLFKCEITQGPSPVVRIVSPTLSRTQARARRK